MMKNFRFYLLSKLEGLNEQKRYCSFSNIIIIYRKYEICQAIKISRGLSTNRIQKDREIE